MKHVYTVSHYFNGEILILLEANIPLVLFYLFITKCSTFYLSVFCIKPKPVIFSLYVQDQLCGTFKKTMMKAHSLGQQLDSVLWS